VTRAHTHPATLAFRSRDVGDWNARLVPVRVC
jgi:hypothetical protein